MRSTQILRYRGGVKGGELFNSINTRLKTLQARREGKTSCDSGSERATKLRSSEHLQLDSLWVHTRKNPWKLPGVAKGGIKDWGIQTRIAQTS